MRGRVLVLGNAGVDLSIGLPRLPMAGETVVGGAFRRAPGGKGLNQAVMAARAGAEVHFLAPLGSDEGGDFVEAALRGERLARVSLPRPGPGTDMSILMVAEDAENCIVTSGACAEALDAATAAGFAASARAGDVLLLQGNLSPAATEAAVIAGGQLGARVVLNTAPLRWAVLGVLGRCWGVVANAGEAAQITGSPAIAAAAALQAVGPALAVVTLGAAGCVTGDGRVRPAPQVRAVDTTGAGDAFCGVLAASLARGAGADEAIAAGQRAAAETVTRHGAFASLPRAFAL